MGTAEYYTICCVKAICQKYWSFDIHFDFENSEYGQKMQLRVRILM